jgi:hypothetical protein
VEARRWKALPLSESAEKLLVGSVLSAASVGCSVHFFYWNELQGRNSTGAYAMEAVRRRLPAGQRPEHLVGSRGGDV